MKHIIIIAAIIFILPQLAVSQTLADAYLISNQRINGTARAGAMGNAFGRVNAVPTAQDAPSMRSACGGLEGRRNPG